MSPQSLSLPSLLWGSVSWSRGFCLGYRRQPLPGKRSAGIFLSCGSPISQLQRWSGCLSAAIKPTEEGLAIPTGGDPAAEHCDFRAPPVTRRLRLEMVGGGRAPALVTASLPGALWETSVLRWSLLGVKQGGSGVCGWGWVISQSSGTVTSITAPSLDDFW